MAKKKPVAAKAKESHEARANRAKEITRRLIRQYPDAKCRLNFSTPFERLVATILSAPCTDDMVNKVTAELFPRARTPEDFARMPLPELEQAVRSTGFFRNKAKSVKNMSAMLLAEFGGRVPHEMEDFVKLPGVARKTANVVRAVAYGLPAIITDTHFIRLSQRMGLTENERPEKIEADVRALLPQNMWSRFSHAMLFHGRAVCVARKPACDKCVVNDLCPSAFKFPHFQKAGAKGC
ncbi:MAG: endonuclease III [Planctomycetota bacterium]|nr:endonuclease III [Planctomycetota bacterium]